MTDRRAKFIERLRAERAASLIDIRARMVAAAAEQGPDSIYHEMIVEHDARQVAKSGELGVA